MLVKLGLDALANTGFVLLVLMGAAMVLAAGVRLGRFRAASFTEVNTLLLQES